MAHDVPQKFQSPAAQPLFWNEVFKLGRSLFEMTVLLVLVLLAIRSICEIVGRQELLNQVTTTLAEIRVDSTDTPGANGKVDARIDTITELKQLRIDSIGLISTGANVTYKTLPVMRDRFLELMSPTPIDPSERHDKFHRSTTSVYDLSTLSSFFSAIGLSTRNFSSDELLAVLVICSGAIGSIIAGLRMARPTTLRQLSLGFCTGFIVFLALKGGRHVFLIQAEAGYVNFNAYSCAFAGLIAGLFTDRAYLLLSTLIEEFTHRVEAAFKSGQHKPHSSAQ